MPHAPSIPAQPTAAQDEAAIINMSIDAVSQNLDPRVAEALCKRWRITDRAAIAAKVHAEYAALGANHGERRVWAQGIRDDLNAAKHVLVFGKEQ